MIKKVLTNKVPVKKEDVRTSLPAYFKNWLEVDPTYPDTWEPKDAGDYIVGTLDKVRTGVGPNASKVYVLKSCIVGNAIRGEETITDKTVSVWDTAVLSARLDAFSVGEEVAILYMGKETNPKTGRIYNNMKVYRKGPF